ncbi:ferredoxin-dependent glutamate synthase 2 chloroplastic [Phtheirospermum japonicum]|uniref:Ferredoxin-dependent glutamate synthase 2 chloroplastic n=1 Tax=Phtheirospermum japonicum TaxID=374723 RepID=A0A830DF04_9LAMI|nr:ferredoxin-dependent glutamate synthase 2 chloroplastic [Phtheirospermum japonicum]
MKQEGGEIVVVLFPLRGRGLRENGGRFGGKKIKDDGEGLGRARSRKAGVSFRKTIDVQTMVDKSLLSDIKEWPEKSCLYASDVKAMLLIRSGSAPEESLMLLVPEAYKNHPTYR